MRIRKEKEMTQLELPLLMRLKSVGLVSVAETVPQQKDLEYLYRISTIFEVPITEF